MSYHKNISIRSDLLLHFRMLWKVLTNEDKSDLLFKAQEYYNLFNGTETEFILSLADTICDRERTLNIDWVLQNISIPGIPWNFEEKFDRREIYIMMAIHIFWAIKNYGSTKKLIYLIFYKMGLNLNCFMDCFQWIDDTYLVPIVVNNKQRLKLCQIVNNVVINSTTIDCIHVGIKDISVEKYLEVTSGQDEMDDFAKKEVYNFRSSEGKKIDLSEEERFKAFSLWAKGIADEGIEGLYIQSEIEDAVKSNGIANRLFRFLIETKKEFIHQFLDYVESKCQYEGTLHIPSYLANIMILLKIHFKHANHLTTSTDTNPDYIKNIREKQEIFHRICDYLVEHSDTYKTKDALRKLFAKEMDFDFFYDGVIAFNNIVLPFTIGNITLTEEDLIKKRQNKKENIIVNADGILMRLKGWAFTGKQAIGNLPQKYSIWFDMVMEHETVTHE